MLPQLTLAQIALRVCTAAWYRRYLIIIPILIMPWAGAGIGIVMPKSYFARMTLLVQDTAALNPFLDELSIPTDIKERMSALIAQMRIHSTVEEIAHSLNWIDENSTQQDIELAVNKLRDQVKARLFGNEVVEISYRSSNPNGMSDILNAFAKHFTERLLAPTRSAVAESENFLQGELARYQGELAKAEERLAQFKSANADNLPALHTENVRRLTSIRQMISEKASSLSGHQARLATTRAKLAQTNPIAGRLDERIAELQSELSILRSRYTDRHSRIQAILHELQQLKSERHGIIAAAKDLLDADLDSLWNIVSSRAADTAPVLIGQLELLQDIAGQIDKIDHELKALREDEHILAGRVTAFGDVEREIARLERDVASKRKLTEQLGHRFEMAKVTSALGDFSTPELVRVIDQPRDPVTPSSLPLIAYILAGLGGGISMGIGLAFTKEMLETRITNMEQIERITGAPIICRFPAMTQTATGLMGQEPQNHSCLQRITRYVRRLKPA